MAKKSSPRKTSPKKTAQVKSARPGRADKRNKGQFIGRVVAEWLADGRKMLLMEDFKYIDKKGVTWLAPNGSVINGASIPPSLWGESYGSPYCGLFRDATVIHDFYCVSRSRTAKETHDVFYEMVLKSGVDPQQARDMYWAVKNHGPSWGPGGKDPEIDDSSSTDWSEA